MIMYYGSKISDNMTKTPEGYLICHNVPIGRTGWMDYLGEEIGLEDLRGQKIKVYRSPEELFSNATIASFEGKPVTNNHPTQNLDVNTANTIARGHSQNVRPEGDFLYADLFMTDPGLIAEVENGKREVSCGYDCLWETLKDDGSEWQQKSIVGNHVAVVQAGRAGHRVAIQDSEPEPENKKIPERRKKMSKKSLFGKMLKAFAQDAEPEEIAEAMDAFGNEGEAPAEQKKEDTGLEQIMTAIAQIGEAVKGLSDRVSALEKADEEVHKEFGADEEFTALEKEVGGEGEVENKDEASMTVEPPKTMDEDPEEQKKMEESMDAAPIKKWIQDMKPIIMAIPDEKARNAAAKQFVKAVRDSRAPGKDGYAAIVNTVSSHKKQAMDNKQNTVLTLDERNEQACNAWNKQNAHYSEGGK
jgi:hypothetical protein